MATSRAVAGVDDPERPAASPRARIEDECLALDSLSAADVATLRAWIGRINGSTSIQPYLVEEAPGRFRLYVGTAAERARTTKGLQ